jgi:streptogramin lyase
VGRFDGNEWRFAAEGEDGAVATRAILNDGGGHMWLATAKGLRALDPAAADAARLGAGDLIVEDDMHALAFDPYGRVWALGDAALAIVDTAAGGRR